jgi:MGT family glycosyltransferase
MKELIESPLKGKKILFATVPADGHVNPLTGLAKYLQELGCDVRWYTSNIFAGKLEKLEIPFYPFQQAVDINANNLTELFPLRETITNPGEMIDHDMIHFFAARSEEYLQDIKDVYKDFKFDLMIADSMFSGIPLVKKALDVPVIAIGIVPLPANSVDLPPYGIAMLPSEDAAEKLKYAELHDGLNNVTLKKSITFFADILDKYDIPNEKTSLYDLLIRQSDLYLQIGLPSFEYTRTDLADNIRFIGGLSSYSGKAENKPWFDERLKNYDQVILVTQGTIERDHRKLLEPTIEAFINTDTLVIVATGGFNTEVLQRKYVADNVIIADFIPFNEVMPYADVYVTNGGYGGTMLSVKNKLPMVAAGVHEGKNEICARIGYFKVGLDLKTDTPEVNVIRDAVNEVLANPVFQGNVSKLARELDAYDPLELSTKHIIEVMRLHALESAY